MQTLGEACAKTDWQVHAWCLMPNHFHLVVETPKPNLVDGMKWLLGTYTGRFNRRHSVCGHLFSGRYKALLVDGSGNGYLKTVCDYVHLNPSRAQLIGPNVRLTDFKWSSFGEYLKLPAQRPRWLRVDRLLGEHGIQLDSAAARTELGRRMEARRKVEEDPALGEALGGWYVGSEPFRQELLAKMATVAGPEHFGREIRESSEGKANRIIAEELSARSWKEEDLVRRRKGDPEKLKIVLRLRRETTMTLSWIAVRLSMGTRSHLVHLLWCETAKKD